MSLWLIGSCEVSFALAQSLASFKQIVFFVFCVWLDWARIRFRFFGHYESYTGSNSLERPVLSSPAHGT
jgi:hypothetical protein